MTNYGEKIGSYDSTINRFGKDKEVAVKERKKRYKHFRIPRRLTNNEIIDWILHDKLPEDWEQRFKGENLE